MPDRDGKFPASKWATAMGPGKDQPIIHELGTRYVVVAATDDLGNPVAIDYQVIADDRLQVSVPETEHPPVTVVIVG
jgi:hypothetical protein